jgi:pimeloyl-ACP methyl ester carboxylesterase
MIFNNKLLIFSVLVILLLGSCGNSKKEQYNKLVKPHKEVLKESSHYTYYLPKDSSQIQAVFLIMDPHSHPNLVMDSLYDYADKNGLALLGLTEIRNGISNYQTIVQRDLGHFMKYKKLGKIRVFAMGFSGAARMALLYANKKRIDGLIIVGAGTNRQNQLPFPTALIAGTRDFNFLEQYYSPKDPKSFERNLIAIHYRGEHQWPPISILEDAMDFVINKGNIKSDLLAESFEVKSKEYLQNKNYYLAVKAMEAAYKLSINDSLEIRRKRFTKLIAQKKVKYYYLKLDKYISEEYERFGEMSNYLLHNDIQWWTNQINYYDSKAASKRNLISADSYARTKAYLGILIYSRLNAAISGRGQFALIPKYLKIYEIIAPKNPDYYFFKGIYAYTQSSESDALKYIKQAKEYGFTDDIKINKFFPKEFVEKLK